MKEEITDIEIEAFSVSLAGIFKLPTKTVECIVRASIPFVRAHRSPGVHNTWLTGAPQIENPFPQGPPRKDQVICGSLGSQIAAVEAGHVTYH